MKIYTHFSHIATVVNITFTQLSVLVTVLDDHGDVRTISFSSWDEVKKREILPLKVRHE